MIRVRKINNETVREVRYHDQDSVDNRPIKGEKLFSELYLNILMVAKKKSGKTTVNYTIVKKCATRDTTVLVFCSTVDKDKSHLEIKNYCRSNNIPYKGYTSMKDGDIDILDELIKAIQEQAKEENESDDEEEPEPPKPKLVLFDSSSEEEDEEERRPRRSRFRSPEYIIIIDDLSNELKSPTLTRLAKMNRHWKSLVIISTQYIHDVRPETAKQCDYTLIFKGQPTEKLEKIYKDTDLSIDFEIFEQLYRHATKDKYNFLYIDVRNECFRKNFEKLYIITDLST